MADTPLEVLARRKEALIARSQAQRTALAVGGRVLVRPMALVDRGLSMVDYVKERPLLLLAGAAVAAAVRPRRAFGLLGRGWMLWRAVQAWRR
jgi:hypothetical protein